MSSLVSRPRRDGARAFALLFAGLATLALAPACKTTTRNFETGSTGNGGATGGSGGQATTSTTGQSSTGSTGGSGGSGGQLAALGTPCNTAAECGSGFCVDGVCCDTACGEACHACSAGKQGGGKDGTCALIAEGTDPDGECSPPSCSGALQSSASVCGAGGACVPGSAAIPCAPYVCGATACLTSCAGSSECVSGYVCSSGVCISIKAGGEACASNIECASSFCVDGVCCDTACTGVCQACSKTKKGGGPDGQCGVIESGTDPDTECNDQGVASCGTNGSCDGNGACQLYPAGSMCAPPSCAGGVQIGASNCNGAGICSMGVATSCGPYACAATACKTSCTADADCASGNYCSANKCKPKGPLGTGCTAAAQCQTGACVDGVCCESKCVGLCMACNGLGTVKGIPGQCDFLDCVDPASECIGTQVCNGNGGCVSQQLCLSQ